MATGCSREEPPFDFGVSLSLIECLSMSPAQVRSADCENKV